MRFMLRKHKWNFAGKVSSLNCGICRFPYEKCRTWKLAEQKRHYICVVMKIILEREKFYRRFTK